MIQMSYVTSFLMNKIEGPKRTTIPIAHLREKIYNYRDDDLWRSLSWPQRIVFILGEALNDEVISDD